MRRRVPAAVLGCATLALGTAVPASIAMRGQDSGARHAMVELARCSPARHKAVFTGRMTRVPGAERMAMRFALLEGDGQGGWSPIRSRRLARWHESLPGVQAFVYRQRLRRLPRGSTYRALVRFRWYSRSGEIVLRARHRSRSCKVPGPRPNLRVLRIRQLSEFDAGRAASYAVRVGNYGSAPARSAQVTLFVDGAAVDTIDAGRLEPGQSRGVGFVGPSCEGPDSPVAALADPNRRVHESRERDNTLATTCADID